jgi:hypothetical protein
MALWRFLDYRADRGTPPLRNLIQDWYGAQGVDVQAEFDATVGVLGATTNWRKAKEFKPLTKKHTGLGELRFSVKTKKHGKVVIRRFRPVGIWREEAGEFIFLIGCEKAHGVYDPAGAFDLALDLKAKLESGEGELCEHY